MGDPRLVANAISLELAFVGLAIASFRWLKYSLIPNMAIACIVFIGNTISPRHVEIMTTLTPLENAIVLIVGGYVLQVSLFVTSFIQFRNRKKLVDVKTKEGEI